MTVGRFAPSPSGRIHLGNILCCLLAWLSARQKGGTIVLRIEDLDTARCPMRYAEQMIRDLLWLGLDWDQDRKSPGQTNPISKAKGRRSIRPPWIGWRRKGWSIPASAPGRSFTPPAPPTGRTGRWYTAGNASI